MRGPPTVPAVSRLLVTGWSAWLLISWAINLWLSGSVPASVEPAVRGMLISMMAGLGLAWPLVRLSQVEGPQTSYRSAGRQWREVYGVQVTEVRVRPVRHANVRGLGRRTAVDLASLLLVSQVVIWPLQLLAGWSLARTALIDAILVVWSLPVALIVWWGLAGSSAARRTLAMGACAALLLAGWALTWWLGGTWSAWSPWHMLWDLADPSGAIDPAAVVVRLVVVMAATAGAGLVLWRRQRASARRLP